MFEHACPLLLDTGTSGSRLEAEARVEFRVEHIGERSAGVRFDHHHWLAFAGLAEAGVILAASSDDPCAPVSPLWGAAKGASRQTTGGLSFEPEQAVPVDDWLAKLRAAVDVRTHLHVTARTDARAPLGLDEAIARARRALDVGVDAVFVEAPESESEMEAIAAALPSCVRVANMVEAGRTPLRTPAELAALGFDLIVSPLSGLFAAVSAMATAYGRLADEGSLRDHLDELVGFDEFTDLVGLPEVRDAETRYRTT